MVGAPFLLASRTTTMSCATLLAFGIAVRWYALRLLRLVVAIATLLRSLGESTQKHTNARINQLLALIHKFQCQTNLIVSIAFESPPIGLSVYDTYGRSESEQTLIGGDTGRELEPGCSAVGDDSRRSLTVLPRIKRLPP